MKHLFARDPKMKRVGGAVEIYVLTSVPKRLLNMLNLAHFDRFGSICVGTPFGPQIVGALALK